LSMIRDFDKIVCLLWFEQRFIIEMSNVVPLSTKCIGKLILRTKMHGTERWLLSAETKIKENLTEQTISNLASNRKLDIVNKIREALFGCDLIKSAAKSGV
jgi:hypothetical protein